jgi:teichuronic acid biosynthesis glycosyltransferase TuaG
VVSVIMPVHDAEDTVEQAIRSVQAQTMTDWELLAVDDASSDRSWDVLTRFAGDDERIVPIRSEEPLGAAGARNRAIERARGRWVAFLDSDDLWLPGKLDAQVAFGDSTGSALTFTSYYKVDAEFDGEAADFRPNGRIIAARPSLTYDTLLEANYVGCLTAMYDRERLGTRLMPDLAKRQDYALWLSILREGGSASGMPEPLALYRAARPGSLSENKRELVAHNWRLYREVEGLSVLRSLRSLATATMRSIRNGRV